MSANRITRREALAVGVASLVVTRAGAAPVPKADPSWVGRTVLPKKYEAEGRFLPPADFPVPPNPDGTPSELRLRLTAASYDVKAEQGTRVEVLEGDGTFLWVEKAEVVLLGDAVEHFTKAIKANEKDTFAIVSRGWAYHLLGKPKEAIKDFDEFLKDATARWDARALGRACEPRACSGRAGRVREGTRRP
jgi:tetratricopeptide (TPR) repeat protein